MTTQDRPFDEETVPDTARSYERAKPEKESGMGRLDNNDDAVPTDRPDQRNDAVDNDHPPHGINVEDVLNERQEEDPPDPYRSMSGEKPPQPDHSMLDEEPLGWDQAPQDIARPQEKRHPRKEGRGGLR